MNAHRYFSFVVTLALGCSVAVAQEKKPTEAPKRPARATAAPKTPNASKGATTSGTTQPHGQTPTREGPSRGQATAGEGAPRGPVTMPATAGEGASRVPAAPGAGVPRGPATPNTGGMRNPQTNTGGYNTPPAGRTPANMSGRSGMSGTSSYGRPVPSGQRTISAPNGSTIRVRPNGSQAYVHDARRGMDIQRGLDGRRQVAVERADHSRVYAERGGRSYVQQPYMYRGQEYGHRTYYYNGRAYDRFYNRYSYHGVYVYGYAPAFYYAQAFYGWAYNPWYTPIPYAWGYVGTPWFRLYGGWFTPAPVYPSASVWLADYLLAQSLQANYAAQQAAAQQSGAPPPQQAMAPDAAPLTPEVRQAIADEVQRQLALENQEAQQNAARQDIDPASSGIARELSDNQPHVFVAGASLDVIDADGAECAVTEGDALQLAGPPAPEATAADLIMLSSKGGQECRKGATVSVAIADLQEMQNHMRETIDAGLGDLQKKGGQGGLPPVPPSAAAPPVKAEFAAVAPPPDPNAAAEINRQVAEADRAEQEVAGQTDASGPSAAAPAEITLGQTIDQVTAILGTPSSIVDLGPKKIYLYKNLKVTFNNGRVTDVQ